MTRHFPPREQAAICRQFARIAGDVEIQRKLIAMSQEYDAKAVKGEANAAMQVRNGVAHCVRDTNSSSRIRVSVAPSANDNAVPWR